MRTHWSIPLAAALLVAGFAGTAQSANWSLALNTPNQVAAVGATATYTGTITNSTGAPLVLDAGLDFVTSPDPETESFTIDFAPGLLALDLVIPTTGYTGEIFKVTWHNDAPGGSYGAGELQLLANAPADTPVLTAPFTLETPGFGPFCDSGTGILAGGNSIASNDSTGNAVIAYNDAAAGTVAYARYDGSVWTATTIANGIGNEAAPSLAMDGDVHPHIAFYDAVNGDLVHAWNPGTGWQSEIIESAGNVGADPSLVADPYGELHVSYYDVTNGDLRYAKRSGGVWTPVLVDATGDVGRFSAITTDEFGHPFISYYAATSEDLKLARKSGPVWASETVDGTGSRGTSPSVKVRGVIICIAYRDATPGSKALRYITGSPGIWAASEVVDAVGDPGFGASLELNAFGQPRIAYFDATSTEVRFAAKGGGGWNVQPVITGGDAQVSLGRSSEDEPMMSYVRGGELRFASVTTCGLVSAGEPVAPARLVLELSRPNPFRVSTTFAFATARAGDVRIRVYDAAGRLIAEPFSGTLGAGPHTITWKGVGRAGQRLAPGRYIYEVRAGAESRTGQIVLLR